MKNTEAENKFYAGKLNFKTYKEDSDVIFVETKEKFTFWNGDEYIGQFCALKDKRKIVMEGEGMYKTSDNQIYEGLWENDGLKEADKIVYQDKSEFYGTLDEMLLFGPGKYKFSENTEIEGNFYNNELQGKIQLRDCNGHLWKGDAEGYNPLVFLYPLHSFWQSVLNLPLKKQIFYNQKSNEENDDLFESY